MSTFGSEFRGAQVDWKNDVFVPRTTTENESDKTIEATVGTTALNASGIHTDDSATDVVTLAMETWGNVRENLPA